MGALFPPSANRLAVRSLWAVATLTAMAIAAPMVYARTRLFTGQGKPIEQPVKFDHKLHAGDAAIACVYCHDTAETSASAGVPGASVCMRCHSQIKSTSPLLAPVRASFMGKKPLEFNRVYDLPGFVYFNHSIHVKKGVGCVTCHGRVDQMVQVEQVSPLTMGWCLDCHRDPDPSLRPLDQVMSMAWAPPGDARAVGAAVRREHDVRTRTSCTTCHR